jgi:Zn-dependent protease with chaperone function
MVLAAEDLRRDMDQARGDALAAETVRRLRRSIDATTLWQLGVLVVVWAGGAALIALIAEILRPYTAIDPRIVVAVWTASGGLVFVPPIERFLSRVLLGLRQPTPAQLAKFQAAWAVVCAQAGIRGTGYVLRVQPVAALNASAGAGHIVGVTATALALPPRQLEAILAHELGHHLGGHAMIGLLHTWYSWPLRTLVRVSMFVGRVASTLLMFLRFSNILTLVLLPFVLLSCFASLLVPLVALPVTVSTIVMRRSELRADATAVRLGYGPELLALYRGWAAYEPLSPGLWRSLRAFFRDTHPRFHTRVRSIERMLGDAAGPS